MRRKIIARLLASVAAIGLALGLTIALTGTSQAANKCVQYPNHVSYMCVAYTPTHGTVYWMDTLWVRTFYWHPAAGDITVQESFYCLDDPTTADGHTDCSGDAPGVPVGTPEAQRRVITLADGCTVYGWNVLDTNTRPPAPKWCLRYSGAERPLTALEVRSVLAYWQAEQLVPGQW